MFVTGKSNICVKDYTGTHSCVLPKILGKHNAVVMLSASMMSVFMMSVFMMSVFMMNIFI